jgi:hypothetical protein
MPTYNSKDGVLTPAHERVAYMDKDGMPQIYDGPDRAATEYMKEQGVDPKTEHLGMHFTENTDMIERAHDKNMSMEQFTKTKVHTQEKRDKAYKENSEKIVTHVGEPKKAMKEKGQSGGGNLKGGFGGEQGPLDDAIKSVK